MKKILSILLSLLTVLSFPTLCAFADDKASDDTYTETYTVSYDEYGSFTPKDEIEINGNKYKFMRFNIVNDNKKTFEITVDNLQKKEYTAPENIINPNDPTQSGKLIKTTFSENKKTRRNTVVSKEVTYSKAQLDYIIPETYKTDYKDDKSGQTISAELKLSETKKSTPYWINTDSLEGVVTGYDALYYDLDNSNAQIPKNEKQPEFKGYESAILKSLNLNDTNYKIIGSSWSGDAYYNSDGILCRNCIYNAQMKVCDITATYSSIVDLPDIVTYTATSVYEDEKDSKYTINAEYEKVQSKINPVVVAVSIGAGLIILAGLIAAILIYLSKKKKSEDNTNVKKI